jgi:hypothetical protein
MTRILAFVSSESLLNAAPFLDVRRGHRIHERMQTPSKTKPLHPLVRSPFETPVFTAVRSAGVVMRFCAREQMTNGAVRRNG